MHDGQQRLPLRDLPPPPIPPQLGHPPPNVLVVRVQPMQQPIPLRDVPLFANPPPNVPENFGIVAFEMPFMLCNNRQCVRDVTFAAVKSPSNAQDTEWSAGNVLVKKVQVWLQFSYRIVAYDLETTVEGGEHRPDLFSQAISTSICAGKTATAERRATTTQ
ncbi:hypothetical protein niasHT_026345 [Heterodera trifolii]|uniref:Uncharacterized protein n=1 Tax=Heterodera trifolii TaxID=157864 RepID=A0ABD2K165_9BILA